MPRRARQRADELPSWAKARHARYGQVITALLTDVNKPRYWNGKLTSPWNCFACRG
jgi:hypothetical protein